jgi:hypothetical protein
VLLGAALVVGCDKPDESKPATPPGSVPEPTAKQANDAANDISAGMNDAADQATDAAASAEKDVADAAESAQDEAADAADAGAANASAAADDASEAAGDQASEASKLIEQATQYIKENKWDLAETTVTKLEGMKASLPENLQPQVDNLRKMLDAGKAAAGSGIKLPG